MPLGVRLIPAIIDAKQITERFAVTEYDKMTIVNGSIPQWMRFLMVFIDRVGFPVIAFCLMFYMAYASLDKVSVAIASNTVALTKLAAVSDQFQTRVTDEHSAMTKDLQTIKERVQRGV